MVQYGLASEQVRRIGQRCVRMLVVGVIFVNGKSLTQLSSLWKMAKTCIDILQILTDDKFVVPRAYLIQWWVR